MLDDGLFVGSDDVVGVACCDGVVGLDGGDESFWKIEGESEFWHGDGGDVGI